jgi:hypothetical protein
LQPSSAIEITSRSKEEADVELTKIARRLVKQYCHSSAVPSSELFGGRKLMESMAAACQLEKATTSSSVSTSLEHASMNGTAASDSSDGTCALRDGQASSESDSDGA